MLNSSERNNSVSWSLRNALRARAINPNSLMVMTFSLPEHWMSAMKGITVRLLETSNRQLFDSYSM